MAKYSETFRLSKPTGLVIAAAREILSGPGWRLMDDSGWAFYAVERMDLVRRLMTYPTKLAVFVREGGDPDEGEAPEDVSRIELHLATFGFGPLPKMRMVKVGNMFKSRLDAVMDRIETEGGPGEEAA